MRSVSTKSRISIASSTDELIDTKEGRKSGTFPDIIRESKMLDYSVCVPQVLGTCELDECQETIVHV
jgi:hypothetical protein